MTRLALLGCYHINRRRYTSEDLDRVSGDAASTAGDPDAYAVELPRFDSLREYVLAALFAPVVFVGMGLIFLFFQGPLFALAARDVISTESSVVLASSTDRDVHLVDRHPLAVLRERSPLWAVANWALLVGAAVIAPVATATVAGLGVLAILPSTVRFVTGRRWLGVALLVATAVGGAWLLVVVAWSWAVALAAAFVGILVIFVTVHDRNREMLEDCERLAEEHGYEELCLLTGRAHLPGMVEVVDEYDLVIDRVLAQERFGRGEFVEPGAVASEAGTSNMGVDVDPERTDGVLRLRALAAIVDLVLVGVASTLWLLFLALLTAPVRGVYGADSVVTEAAAIGVALAWFVVPVGYFVVQELRYGQTIGHRLARIEVVSIDGESLSRTQVAFRTLSRILEFLPACYLFGFVVALSGDGSRRLGDLRVGTAVVHERMD